MKPMSTTAPTDSGIPDGDDVDWYSSAVSPTTGIETPSSIHLHTATSTELKDVSTQTEDDKKYNKHRKESIKTQALLVDTLKMTHIIAQDKEEPMENEELETTIDEKNRKIEQLEKQVKNQKATIDEKNRKIEQLEKQVKNQEATIDEKNRKIEQLEKQVKNQEATIDEKDRKLEKK